MAKIKKSSQAVPVDQDRQWKIESAMSTLLRYNDLMKDKVLMNDVQKKAQDQLNTVTTLKNGGMVKKAVKKTVVKKAAKAVVKKVVSKKASKKK